MDRPDKDHNTIARLTLSGTEIDIGTYESGRSPTASVWIQTDENLEPVYMKPSEASVLLAALMAAVDFIEEGE